jgi:hypothetical protein
VKKKHRGLPKSRNGSAYCKKSERELRKSDDVKRRKKQGSGQQLKPLVKRN